jgi:NADPH:quinone reductase
MRSVRVHEFGGPEVLRLEEVPDLHAGDGQVLVKLQAAGVNPVDTYVRSGASGPREFPYTPGSDGAGTVVGGSRQGQRVYLTGSLSGTYADYALCSEAQVHPLPDNISAAQGAALYVPYYTAYRALFQRGQARPGEWVLIHGASGAVGLAALQWGRAHGLRMIGTGGTPEGRRLVGEHGAEHVLDHREPGYLDEVTALTGGAGPSLILEMLANVNLQSDLNVVAKYGRIVVIGNRGTLDFNPRGAMLKEADVRGMLLFNTPEPEMQTIHHAVGAGLRCGILRPVVSREFPLAEAAQAHEAVLQPGTLGKIVLVP